MFCVFFAERSVLFFTAFLIWVQLHQYPEEHSLGFHRVNYSTYVLQSDIRPTTFSYNSFLYNSKSDHYIQYVVHWKDAFSLSCSLDYEALPYADHVFFSSNSSKALQLDVIASFVSG